MSDWWAMANWEGENAEKTNRAPMVLAQNDIFMCCADAAEEMKNDNVREKILDETITRGDLQRNAQNILQFLLDSPAMLHEIGKEECLQMEGFDDDEDEELSLTDIKNYQAAENSGEIYINEQILTKAGKSRIFDILFAFDGEYRMEVSVKSDLDELAQLPVSVYVDNIYRSTLSFQGSKGEEKTAEISIGNIIGKNHYVKLAFGANGLEVEKIKIFPAKKNK